VEARQRDPRDDVLRRKSIARMNQRRRSRSPRRNVFQNACQRLAFVDHDESGQVDEYPPTPYSRNLLVRWLSGRKQRFAKAPYPKRVPRVRIPPSPFSRRARQRTNYRNRSGGGVLSSSGAGVALGSGSGFRAAASFFFDFFFSSGPRGT